MVRVLIWVEAPSSSHLNESCATCLQGLDPSFGSQYFPYTVGFAETTPGRMFLGTTGFYSQHEWDDVS